MIRFKQLPIGKEEKDAVGRVIDAGSLSIGKFVEDFENEFAEFIGAKHAVAVNSCTSALFLSLLCENRIRYCMPFCDWESSIRIPSMMVPVVPNSLLHAGAKVMFIDDVSWVGKEYLLKPYGVWDSAHLVKPKQYKKYNDQNALVCFSFYPTKSICGPEGGMIATDNDEMAEWLKKARWYGRGKVATRVKNSWEYDIEFPGWKMNMTDIQAAIAHCGLEKFDWVDSKNGEVVERYNKAFGLKNDSHYLYRIYIAERDLFVNWMKDKDIECGIHFIPLHWQNAYRNIPRDDMKRTDIAGKHTVSLPLHPFLTTKEVDYIIGLVNEWKEKHETPDLLSVHASVSHGAIS
jgi:dTDP-4-amino-4,6-dideoxygalactose transaminase